MASINTLYYTNPKLRDEWDDVNETMKQYIPVSEKVMSKGLI